MMEEMIQSYMDDDNYIVTYCGHLGMYVIVNKKTAGWFSFSYTRIGKDKDKKKWGRGQE